MCAKERICFVVQGFGEKTDLTTGRVLNLDASYEVIKEAVEDAGLKCIRADDIVHSGTIDKPMYDWLFRADLVVADLSTYNVNAAFELGVRYGLRPQATIIVAEGNFKNPFDITHIVIRHYEHLGKDIGRKEAQRFKKELSSHIKTIVETGEVDSPVYTFLSLRPPSEIAAISETPSPSPAIRAAVADIETDRSAKDMLEQGRAALAKGDFLSAKTLFQKIRSLRPRDEYVVQQLAFATYKSKSPDAMTALNDARALLMELRPDVTNDPETLGLWGAVHKRFWDQTNDRQYLDQSIAGYERGFYLKQDYYNGINLAFLLDLRATLSGKQADTFEAIADAVLARRVRREVVRLCEAALGVAPKAKDVRYWIVATLWEAAVGLNDQPAVTRWKTEAEQSGVPTWMIEGTVSQLEKLAGLLKDSPLSAETPRSAPS